MVDTSALIASAKGWLGVPYVFGGSSRSGIDCSGLVMVLYKQQGISLPHHSEDQARYGQPVDKTAIQPGDLVFSDWGDGPNSHVGIATTSSQIIDAPHPGTNVRYDTLTPGYLAHVTAVRRLADGSAVPPSNSSTASSSQAVLTGLPDPISLLADGIKQAVPGVLSVGKLADQLTKLANPTNLIRVACLAGGAFFVGAGVIFLAREVRD